ncbi:MAG: bifunctional GNAT family N-acetyltransferase/carbon-nitrogen hydrolase family protein [Microscillaceae bacterium]|nr:bifunctional GNAT family N-acetyltransferase/carbon-nitrogen hydrolase family protein [Microscillaceae bacterium]
MTQIAKETTEHVLLLRNLQLKDYNDIKEITRDIYQNMGIWEYHYIRKLLKIFPEGQICIEDKGKVVAFALSILLDENDFDDDHSYFEIVGNGSFSTHNPKGNILYGIEIGVHPDYQGMRLGRRLYDARKEICENLNLKAIVAGGRMPNYHLHSKDFTPKQYIDKVKSKEIYDPVLTFQLGNDFHVRKILTNYLPGDTDSEAYATLIEWNNIYYQRKEKVIGAKKTWVRIGVVQWLMRRANSLEAFFENVEFFVDAVSNYKADFVLFPELFNAPLMSEFNEMNAAEAVRKLSEFTEDIKQRMLQYALEYNINIIAGSLPLYQNGDLFNVSYLCRRDGTYGEQYKIHPTPTEVNEWGMKGGHKLQVFDTDVGKIGILICYDSEFPELSRILADQGMKILFVPSSTDLQSGYHRVRYCSQARAIENECYVVLAGSVGQVPKAINMDLQFSQSAIFSPSDFAFPQNAIIAEGTPNNEMTLIADVDLDLLKELHLNGTVRNLMDRRTDLFELKWIGKD